MGWMIAIFGPPLIVGWVAQSWKGRTGAGWGLLMLVLDGLGTALVFIVMDMARAWQPFDARGDDTLMLSALTAGTLLVPIMLLIVASLPNLKAQRAQALDAASGARPDGGESPPAGDGRPCPHCAETIKRAAVVCRFCNRDVSPA